MVSAGNQLLSVCKGSTPCFQDVNSVKDAQDTHMLSSCAPYYFTSPWPVYLISWQLKHAYLQSIQ